MQIRSLALFLTAAAVLAAQAPPAAAPASGAGAGLTADSLVVTIEGHKYTFGELMKVVRALGPQAQQGFNSDRKSFLQQLALLIHLAGEAEKNQLDQRSPYKDQLDSARQNILAQAFLREKFDSFPVSAEEQQKYYDSHKDGYVQVKLKVLYVAFSSGTAPAAPGVKKSLSEPEAKAKVEKLLADARGGADFVKLIKENSDDAASAAKDGDFGVFKRSDNIPEPIKAVVFRLPKGQISEPVRQPNGFYLFRAEELTARPYAEVKDEVFTQLKQDRWKVWLDSVRGALNVKIENEAFLSAAPPAPAPDPPSKPLK